MKYKNDILIKWCCSVSCLSALFVLWGCASGAHVVSGVSIPDPLIDSFPMKVGIYYPAEMKDYVWDDKKGRQSFVVELGDNQEQVFEKSLGALFDEVVVLESEDDSRKDLLDGVFYPNITGLTLTIPAENGTDFYEMWIRYELLLLQPNGTYIYKWPVPGYGRVNRRDYGSVMERTNEAVLDATESALRGACTEIIVRFSPRRMPLVVKDWIELNSGSSTLEQLD